MCAHIVPGTVIADRFEVSTLAGTGGMSCVYKARDLHTSRFVALKILLRAGNYGMALQRFSREATLIAELRHPGTPSFVASGNTADGKDYLAMEWLEGETLSRRLERGLLTVRECQLLLERVAKVLACIHQLEIVHRDIKPSNLFLCDARFERVVLLDFGVAHCRPFGRHTSLTSSGTMVGTVGYIAPEQVRDAGAITAAADIYSLGLVAYESLAGRDLYPQHAAAALARTLLEDRPALSAVCPRVPPSLSELIGRMLVRDPELRPQDGVALQQELQALGPLHDIGDKTTTSMVGLDVNTELRLHTLVMAADAADESSRSWSPEPEDSLRTRQALAETLIRVGEEPIFFPDGSLLLTLPLESSIHDQVAKAARCALLIKTQWPAAEVAIATGRAQANGPSIIGEVVDRAAALVCGGRARRQANAQLDVAGSVWADPLSAALLERRFVLVPLTDASLLTGESMSAEVICPILGRSLPYLGREHDLSILEMLLSHCRAESHAQAVLVTAPAGIGKTRLRQEFVLRTKGRPQPLTILLGVAQILSLGAPYAVLGDGLRRLFGIQSGGDAGAANHRLLAACTEVLGETEARLAAPFLGILCGLPWQGSEGAEVRAARSDPKIMASQLLAAVTSLIDAWCRRGPVLWILEDLQWSDFLSLKLIGGLLRCLEERPFMVLALARPEVKTEFPILREWPTLKEWPLEKLGRAASEKLVHCALGDKLGPGAVAELVRQADGNVLFLEELIRSASQEKVVSNPDTVLAMLQARLQQLDLPERRMLGRASIFGERFWRRGLLAIARTKNCNEVDIALQQLAKAEFITVQNRSTRAHDVEYIFCHALLREAVYSLLGDEQRRQWHADAGAYLASAGDVDSLVVAEHFARSNQPHRSISYFAEAAKYLLEGGDLPGARSCIERGLACQVAGWEAHERERHLRGQLLHLKARLLYQSLDFTASLPVGEEALRLLPEGSAQWCQAFHGQFAAAMLLGQRGLLRSLAGQFLAVEPQPDAVAAYAESGGVLLSIYSFAGQRAAASAILAHMQGMGQYAGADDPVAKVWMHVGELHVFRLLEGAPGLAWLAGQRGTEAAARTHSQRSICYAEAHAAICEMELGMENGEARLRAAIPLLGRAVGENSHAYAAAWLAFLLSRRPEHRDEAERLAKAQLALAQQKQSGIFSGLAQLALSRIYLATNRRSEAEVTAAAALELLAESPPLQLGAYTKLIKIRLAAGELDSARRVAQEGLSKLQALGERGWMDLALRLATVEVEFASDRPDQGRAALRSALAVLGARAEQFPDAKQRPGYLTGLPENARLLALGREHCRDAMERFDRLMESQSC